MNICELLFHFVKPKINIFNFFSDVLLIEKVFLFWDFNTVEDLSSQRCLFLMSYAERDDGLKTNAVRTGCLLSYFSKPPKVYVCS